MRISVTRRGGFAGVTVHREIDTSTLDASAREALERTVEEAVEYRNVRRRMPDAFEYEISIDGKTYVVSDEHPAWRALLDRVGSTITPSKPSTI